MQREQPEDSSFFSAGLLKDLDFEACKQLQQELKKSTDNCASKSCETTITNLLQEKTQIMYEAISNSKVDDSCYQDFQDFIKKMPNKSQQPFSNTSMFSEFSISKQRKLEVTPSYIQEKQAYRGHSNWLSDLQLRCTIEYNSKKINTVCRIKDAEIQFQNGGCAFRLTKIIKMKILFEDYRKCICFTYDELRGKKKVELKFKIFVENDLKDDLYILYSKIVVQKLLLLDYSVDVKQKQDPNADKFIMAAEIYKMSQVMHKWKLRKLVLTDKIESFKGEKCTFQMKNIKQMWTRFSIYEQCLIVKLRHGKEKTELALPIVNYPVRYCKNNWLYRIYRLLTSAA